MINKQKGFTLIELLVVIAIIGILSSVVLASLNTARNKGADTAVKENLANARSQAEIVYDAQGSYSGICTAGNVGTTGLKSIYQSVLSAGQATGLSAINAAIGTAGTYNTATCHISSTNDAWAAEAPLKASASGSPVMWCVDSTGKSQQETDNLTSNDVTCS